MNVDMNAIVGNRDIVFVTLDTLRLDVAQRCFNAGETPGFRALFPGGWEARHTPGSFTYAAHHAFFAGFLPTPVSPPWPPRLFAARFPGSETIGRGTWVFEEPDVVTALRARGYHTLCIGGVGFFNKLNPLSCVLPSLFEESHWSRETGVTDPDSTRLQFQLAARRAGELPAATRMFLFINVSAIHQPNRHYIPGAETDSLETHAAALRYVDGQLPVLLDALRRRGGAFMIFCSDHGTLYGEEGFTGHRVAHPAVWNVPYAVAMLEGSAP